MIGMIGDLLARLAASDDADTIIRLFAAYASQFGFSTFILKSLGAAPGVFPGWALAVWPASWAAIRIAPFGAGIDSVGASAGADDFATPASAPTGPASSRSSPPDPPVWVPEIVLVGGGSAGEEIASPLRIAIITLERRLKELGNGPSAESALRGPALSPGEIDCVRWLLAGKTDREIAGILNIAEPTAHWRIERAKAKLGVKTRAQLTGVAVHLGYVRP